MTPFSDFIQQEPHEGSPATEKTEAWIFFDDRNIYISARCSDSHPEREIANEMRRDSNNVIQNESFTVIFDSFHDKRNGVFFQTNALGALRDAMSTDDAVCVEQPDVSINARRRWEYEPLSELFVVYSDGRDTTASGFPRLGNRALIIKINKLFRV